MLSKSKKDSKKISFGELTDEELNARYDEYKKELQDLRFKMVTSTVPNVRRMRFLKRDIARIMTVRRQREMQSAK